MMMTQMQMSMFS